MLSDARVYTTICFLARLHLATYYIIHDLGLRIWRTGTSFIHLRLPNNSRIYTKLTSHSFCNPILKTSSSSCRLFCSGRVYPPVTSPLPGSSEYPVTRCQVKMGRIPCPHSVPGNMRRWRKLSPSVWQNIITGIWEPWLSFLSIGTADLQ